MLRDKTGAMALAAPMLAISALATAGPALAQDAAQGPLTERHETMESAVATPAEDLNLKQTPIPDVLQRAVVNPYDMRTLDACDAVAAEVQRLDAALGADRDEPPTPDTRTVDEKRDSTAASALRLGIEAVTPYRGIVRWATGADAHARQVQIAIEAGFARRGFIKGMAVKMNCAPPASPAWFRPSQTAQRPAYTAYQAAPAPTNPRPAYAAPPRYAPYAQPYQAPAQDEANDRYAQEERDYRAYRDRADRDYQASRGYRYDPSYDPYDR